jgi:uncharacterized protein (DUF1330 family)
MRRAPPRTIEGVSRHQRVVIIELPDAAAFDAWYRSAAYQEIARDRWAATEGVVTLVRGLPKPRE